MADLLEDGDRRDACPTAHALRAGGKNLIERKVVAQAIKDLGVDPEMVQPQIV